MALEARYDNHFSRPEDIDEFIGVLERYEKGELSSEEFRQFRLTRGVYGQRQEGVQMIRVKIPQGVLAPRQLEVLADVAEKFAPRGVGHVTTRQNVQFHFVKMAQVEAAMRRLHEGGLTTREACGNTVRNVTGDPWAGVNANEPFDPTPYAGAYARYWLRNPLSQLLPRKWKVCFSSSDEDIAITGLHDMGFIPRVRDGQKGFEVRVAGGLSIMPRNAQVLREFSPLDDYLRISEAVIRVFEKADELRKNQIGRAHV